MTKKEYYRPLPHMLTIKESAIEGLGLFATRDIDHPIELGVTHVENKNFVDGLIRTPLGGFINHSEEPNCKLREVGHEMYLQTIQKIKAGEELTLKYQMYNPVEIKDEW